MCVGFGEFSVEAQGEAEATGRASFWNRRGRKCEPARTRQRLGCCAASLWGHWVAVGTRERGVSNTSAARLYATCLLAANSPGRRSKPTEARRGSTRHAGRRTEPRRRPARWPRSKARRHAGWRAAWHAWGSAHGRTAVRHRTACEAWRGRHACAWSGQADAAAGGQSTTCAGSELRERERASVCRERGDGSAQRGCMHSLPGAQVACCAHPVLLTTFCSIAIFPKRRF